MQILNSINIMAGKKDFCLPAATSVQAGLSESEYKKVKVGEK